MNFQDRYQYNPKFDYLGGGAFADVFKAYDTLLDRTVALKFYKGTGSQYDVLNEIKTVIKQDLTHPNLIRYYDAAMVEMTDRFGRTTQNQVGIIEYANGKEFLGTSGDLNAFMKVLKPDKATFKNTIREILQGLDYLGKRSIIHRDLKPANILLHKTTEGKWTAKIADFGLSKSLDSSATSTQGMKGTIEYMAPEQLYRKKYALEEGIQANADLWAFGTILYELFVQHIPVGRRSEGSTVEEIMENLDLFEPNRLVLQDIPMPYRGMIQACLVKFPQHRVQTAEQLLEMLDTPIAENTLKPVPSKPTPTPSPSPQPSPSPPKPTPQKKWLLGIALLVLMGIGGLWTSGFFSDSDSNLNPNPAIDSTEIGAAKRIEDSLRQIQLQKEQDSIQTAEEAAIAKENQFKELLADANTAYVSENYKTAKEKYTEALQLQPKNKEAKGGLDKTKEKLKPQPAPSQETTTTSTKPTQTTPTPEPKLPTPIQILEQNMVRVPGGSFNRGCDEQRDGDCQDDEKPVHSVTLSTFEIGRYEITQAQWQAVMGDNPSHFKDCGSNCPVENVSWNDIQTFLQKLNKMTGKTYRLPTEAEWEFAARGGNSSQGYRYSGSNNLDKVAWYGYEKAGKTTHPVGEKNKNELGLYDMSGNVWEWCADWYDENYYANSPSKNPRGASSGTSWVLRGGSWFLNSLYCRSAVRFWYYPSLTGSYDVGFRISRTL